HARSGCRHQRALRPPVALVAESVSAFGEAGEEGARGQQGAPGVRRGAYPIRAGAGVHARGCAESGAARAVAKVSGPVSNESEHRAQTGAHLSPGKSPPEPEGGAGNGARAEMRRPGQRQWKSRCAWESRTPRGIPTFPQPQQQTFGYISNVSTTPARVTFLNGSTGGTAPQREEVGDGRSSCGRGTSRCWLAGFSQREPLDNRPMERCWPHPVAGRAALGESLRRS